VKILFSGMPTSLHLHLLPSETKCSEHTTSLFHVQKELFGSVTILNSLETEIDINNSQNGGTKLHH
jgi:hypothetical protein